MIKLTERYCECYHYWSYDMILEVLLIPILWYFKYYQYWLHDWIILPALRMIPKQTAFHYIITKSDFMILQMLPILTSWNYKNIAYITNFDWMILQILQMLTSWYCNIPNTDCMIFWKLPILTAWCCEYCQYWLHDEQHLLSYWCSGMPGLILHR